MGEVLQAEGRVHGVAQSHAVFGLHHLAHAHMALTSTDHIGGQDARSMKAAMGAAPPSKPDEGNK